MLRILTANLGLKVLALVLAMITWLFVRTITNDTRTVEVPVEVNTRAGYNVLSRSDPTVNVTLRGTREDMRQVTRDAVSVVIDLSKDERSGMLDIRLRPRLVQHPPGVQVVSIEPAKVSVQVDQMVDREFPVQPQTMGELPSGFVAEKIVARPLTVRLRVPKQVADSNATVKTLPIDLTGRRTPIRERVELEPLDPNMPPGQRRWVEVYVNVVEAPDKKGEPSP